MATRSDVAWTGRSDGAESAGRRRPTLGRVAPNADLYVASDQISDQNFDVAYGEVLRLAGKMQDPDFDAFRVKLIGGDNPLARAALDIYQRYPAKVPTWFNGKNFGGMSVERVYIYPTKVTAPTKFYSGE